MSQNPDIVFSTLVNAELAGFQEFNHLLKKEQGALIKGEIEQLTVFSAKKSELVSKLAELGAQRIRLITLAGYENNASGISAYLDAIQAQKSTRALWEKLLDTAREVEQVNLNNGILIDTHLRHNQQTLSVLQSAANPVSSLYGPNGQISSAASGRRLDKA